MKEIRLLLADDHTLVREGTRELLEREPDLRVIAEAADGEEAVRLATELNPDVVILDVSMPKINGIEATKRIKAALPSTAILVLTAYDNDQYIFATLEAGALGYLLKSVSASELINAVRAVHQSESALHPAVARKVVDRFASLVGKPNENRAANQLSERELDVLRLTAKGLSNKDIAQELIVSVRTVQAHMGNIFRKMDVNSRTEAVLSGLKKGLLTLDNIPE